MIRFALATLVLPLAFATHIPLPSHRPKGVSAQTYGLMMQNLKKVKQFDLAKLGIPVESSLRLVGEEEGPLTHQLIAASPKSLPAMLAWYQKHLPGWETLGARAGVQAFLAPKGSTLRDVFRHTRPTLRVAACRRGRYLFLPCASTVTFYKPKAHPPH